MTDDLEFENLGPAPEIILIYDTETTGLPNFKLPADDPSQPRMCSIAALVCDPNGVVRNGFATLIRPDGWVIAPEATEIHGHTTEECARFGIPALDALAVLSRWYEMADRRVAHHIAFDNKIMRGELRRAGLPDHYDKAKDYCTMHNSRSLCRLPPTGKMMGAGRKTFKSPSLAEAYEHFFGQPIKNPHTALGDVNACRAIYFAINPPPKENAA